MGPTKRINPNLQQEKQGLLLLQQVVKDMGCIWRPTPTNDYGIDGEIEIVVRDAPTNLLIKVQCKAGTSYIHKAPFGQFDYYARESDLSYWDQCNVPVILVVCDPQSGKIYWKHVQGYVKSNPQILPPPHSIRFSRRTDVFDKDSYVKLCSLVLKDEAELNELLKEAVHENLRSNLLAARETPACIFHFSVSLKAAAELSESGVALPETMTSKDEKGGRWTFHNPLGEGFPAKAWVESGSITSVGVTQYLRERGGPRIFAELANKALATKLKSCGLLEREKGRRFYFPPEPGPEPRLVTWQTPYKHATRQVAYPYVSKKSGRAVFWVHHSLRAHLRSLGSQWLLQLEPGYVFTRDGIAFVASEHVGRLTTKKVSLERNQQVLNHLLFWAWFLRDDKESIWIPCGDQRFVFEASFAGGRVTFGIPADRRRVRELVDTSPDIDWGELEEGISDERQDEE